MKINGQITSTGDLQGVYNLVKEILGDDIISMEQFRSMHDANPNISHNIQRNNIPVGFVSFSFLNAAAFEGLSNGSLETLNLTGEHQSPTVKESKAIYIGAVGAIEDRQARRETMKYLDNICAEYKKISGAKLLAKPVTSAGLRAFLKRGYAPLHRQAGLGQLYICP